MIPMKREEQAHIWTHLLDLEFLSYFFETIKYQGLFGFNFHKNWQSSMKHKLDLQLIVVD